MPSIVKARSVVVVPAKSHISKELDELRSGEGGDESPEKRIKLLEARVEELEEELEKARAQAEMISSDQIYQAKIAEAEEQAKEIIQKAEEEGLSAVAQARMSAKGITDEAERSGYNIGYNKGLTDGEAKMEEQAKESMNEVAYLIEALNMERMQTCKEEEKEILRLAFEVAKKIMRQQIKVEPDAVPLMVEDIVKEHETAVKVTLTDYNLTLDAKIDRKVRDRIKQLIPNVKLIVVPCDGEEEIFQIETEEGLIDAAVSGQLERLEEATEDYGDPVEED